MRKLLVCLLLMVASCSSVYMGNIDSRGAIHPGPDSAGGALVFGGAVMRFNNWRIPDTMRAVDGIVTRGLKVRITASFKGKRKGVYTVYPDEETGYFQIVNVNPNYSYKVTSIELPVLGFEKKPDWPVSPAPKNRLLNLGQYIISVDSKGNIRINLHHCEAYLSTDTVMKAALKRNGSTGWVKMLRARLTDVEPNARDGALVFGTAQLNIKDRKGRIHTKRAGLRVVIAQYAPAFLYGRVSVFTDKNGYFQLTNVSSGHGYAIERIVDPVQGGVNAKFPSPNPIMPRGRILNLGVNHIDAQVGSGVFCRMVEPDKYNGEKPPVSIAVEKHKDSGWHKLLIRRIKHFATQK